MSVNTSDLLRGHSLDGEEINFNTSRDAIAADHGSINTPTLAEVEVANEDTIRQEVEQRETFNSNFIAGPYEPD